MADVLTTLYAFVKQTIGGNRNTWGGILNSNFDKVEAALAGVTTKVLSGGSYPLTDAERRTALLSISGVLTAKQTIVVQNIPGWINVMNSTSGNYPLQIKTATGTPKSIPRSTIRRIWCDGANNLYRDDNDFVGTLFHHAGTAVPPWALENNGAVLLIDDYPDLYNKIGTTYGGDGISNFMLPNETDTGRFRRARTSSIVLGTKQSNAFKSHTHTGSVTISTSGTTGASGSPHTHTFSGTTSGQSNTHTHGGAFYAASTAISDVGTYALGINDSNRATSGASADHTHTYSGTTSSDSTTHTHTMSTSGSSGFTTDGTGDTETRPESIAFIACIRY